MGKLHNGSENRVVSFRKLMAVICEKTRQMPPSIINLLWLSSSAEIPKGALTTAVGRRVRGGHWGTAKQSRRCNRVGNSTRVLLFTTYLNPL